MEFRDYKGEKVKIERLDLDKKSYDIAVKAMYEKISQQGITINNIGYIICNCIGNAKTEEEDGDIFKYRLVSQFIGTDAHGIISMYNCTADIEGFADTHYVKSFFATPDDDDFPEATISKLPETVNLNTLYVFPEELASFENMVYLSQDSNVFIYKRETNSPDGLGFEYLQLELDASNGCYTTKVRELIGEFIDASEEKENSLYIRLNNGYPEDDEKTPYMCIPNSKGIIEKIIDSSASSQVEAARYREVFRDVFKDFLLYSITYPNGLTEYRFTLKADEIGGSVADQLWEKNYEKLELSGEIISICNLAYDYGNPNENNEMYNHTAKLNGGTINSYSRTCTEFDDDLYNIYLTNGEDAVAYVRNAVDENNRQLTLITFNRRKED